MKRMGKKSGTFGKHKKSHQAKFVLTNRESKLIKGHGTKIKSRS